jgi:hypothetical protein
MGHFKGKFERSKSRGPLEISQNMPHYESKTEKVDATDIQAEWTA